MVIRRRLANRGGRTLVSFASVSFVRALASGDAERPDRALGRDGRGARGRAADDLLLAAVPCRHRQRCRRRSRGNDEHAPAALRVFRLEAVRRSAGRLVQARAMTRLHAPDPRLLAVGALYVAAYVALDWASFIDPIGAFAITPWNPPPGLSLAFLFRRGLRQAGWLFVAALAAEFLVRGAPAPLPVLVAASLVLAIGYTALAAFLTRVLRVHADLSSLREATVFLVAAALACGVIAVAFPKLFYVLFLPVIWIAMRHGIEGAVFGTLAVQLGLIAAILVTGRPSGTVLEFQFLMLAIAATALLLGAAVSERRAIERQLRDKQSKLDRSLRLAAASELASALAHELNQPLSAITAYLRACQLMLAQPPDDPAELAQTMDKVIAEASRAGSVVRRLRDF